jgi:hypothetical protein
MKLRPIYCLAIASLVSAPVTWYVWTEQIPLERELVSLARESGMHWVPPARIGFDDDPMMKTVVAFESEPLSKVDAAQLIDRFNDISSEHRLVSVMCGTATFGESGDTIPFPRWGIPLGDKRGIDVHLHDSRAGRTARSS